MNGLKVSAAKSNFFDRKSVINAVDRATRGVLSKFGAFVRRRAKSSIRKRKRTSEPGAPPSSHTGLLKDFIYFGYDPARRSVVIGPALLNSTVDANALPALEYGGNAVVEDPRTSAKRNAAIAARPFMTPAFEAEKPGLPAMWKDSVRP